MTDVSFRLEHDLLGDHPVPVDAYWGVHTARARANFPITGVTIGTWPDLVEALAAVKEAAAFANHDLGLLEADLWDAVRTACTEIRGGALHEQFVVDVMQGGAGTSTNMNANEVIANRGLELLGRRRGDYSVLHPNEHVNMSQSTNDVYPTAIRIALIKAADRLDSSLALLQEAFHAKEEEFDGIVKIGRTQLQDAVPMTLGQEFGSYAVMVGEDRQRLAEASTLLHELNLGATAIGTRLNAPDGYTDRALEHLRRLTGLPLVGAAHLVEATQDCGAFVQVSAALKRAAVKLSKVCNDLRLLSSGPRAGLGELTLPPVQAGSSIMPGKVNPVIPEVLNQVAFRIIGADVTVTFAAEGGQLQLNAFEPVIFASLAEGFEHLTNAVRVLAERCVSGISPDRERLRRNVEESIGLATVLNPVIGYAAATQVASRALATGRRVADIILEEGLAGTDQLREALRPDVIAGRSS